MIYKILKRNTIPVFCICILFAQEKRDSSGQIHPLEKYRSSIHLVSHGAVPAGIAYLIKTENDWKKRALTYLLANLVDSDHFLAQPVYDSNRCSINLHPLHSEYALFGFSLLALNPLTKDVGTGLLIHMGLDYIDCELMQKNNSIQTDAFNEYTLAHFLFWYGIGKYSNLQADEMFAISMVWEVTELKLPFHFAREGWVNKSVDLVANYFGFISGRG